jgi:hypothetical protein
MDMRPSGSLWYSTGLPQHEGGGPVTRIATALHAYRQLGVRDGTAAAARRAMRAGHGRLRAVQLAHRPLHIGEHELQAALGDRDAVAALAAAGRAIPSLDRWQRSLAEQADPAREGLLRRADEAMAHRFDLLGSGPTDLGRSIDWHRDFKTGRVWPLHHISRIKISYPDSSDIKVPWELSRFQHLPLLAAAHRVSGERRYLDEVEAQLGSWIATNPVEFGVNWACTMDVAIRAINWVAALVLCATSAAGERWLDDALASLLLHARFIRSHLEHERARGNHYLSDVVGLLIVAGVFERSDEGRRWIRWATRQLSAEMRHQVRRDGCDHEASTSYHRLVTELFAVGMGAAEVLAPGELDPEMRAGLDRMLQFVADYTRPDGLAPQIGDADDGRILPLGDYGSADQRSHLHLFGQANKRYVPAKDAAAYPDGGFYLLRAGRLYAPVRCGDVGIYGRGCHAHNDLLAFELSYDTTPLVIDPGSYLYTADPAARNRFRSTAAHSTLQVDEAEQNELRLDRLFALPDRTKAVALGWDVASDRATFCGRHHGYSALPSPAIHTRALCLDGRRDRLEIVDEIESDGPHQLTWHFPLAPCVATVVDGAVEARFTDVVLRIAAIGTEARVEPGTMSPSYGVLLEAPVARLVARSEPGLHRTVVTLEITRISPEATAKP